jgi:FlaA1/EpsC-like NDP-sugar epimerase
MTQLDKEKNMLRLRVLSQPRRVKQMLVAVVDVALALLALWLAFAFRTENLHWPRGAQWMPYVASPLLALPVFVRNGLYRAVFRYSGMAAMAALTKAVLIYAVLFAGVLWLWVPAGVPRSVALLQPLLLLLLAGGVRALARQWLSAVPKAAGGSASPKRLVIYGAGGAGVQTAMALSRAHEFELVAFVDDSPVVQGRSINGTPVWSPSSLAGLVKEQGVTELLLAMPSISRERRLHILAGVQKLPLHVRSVPAMVDLAQGKFAVSDIKELDIEDLLGRESVDPAEIDLPQVIEGQVVLVTGAGGSIGSELCRQVLALGPQALVLVEHSEFSLYAIHRELEAMRSVLDVPTVLHPVLCNVQNESKVLGVFKTHRPHLVYHAAAYKHVPLVEHNPAEGVANNFHRQSGAPHQCDGGQQTLVGVGAAGFGADQIARRGRRCQAHAARVRFDDHVVAHLIHQPHHVFDGEVWQCAGQQRQCGAFVSRTNCQWWAHHADRCKGNALFHDHSRGGAFGHAGGGDGARW